MQTEDGSSTPEASQPMVDESLYQQAEQDRALMTHWFDKAQTSHLGLDHAINVALGLAESALKKPALPTQEPEPVHVDSEITFKSQPSDSRPAFVHPFDQNTKGRDFAQSHVEEMVNLGERAWLDEFVLAFPLLAFDRLCSLAHEGSEPMASQSVPTFAHVGLISKPIDCQRGTALPEVEGLASLAVQIDDVGRMVRAIESSLQTVDNV
jgi:hypothetical protein